MFGFLIALLAAVYFFFELKNTRAKYHQEKRDNARELFELTILSELSEKIGYSLSSRNIAATIAVTVEKLFQVTSVSYAIIESDHVELVTTTHENVGPHYISGVKEFVLQGVYGIDENLKKLPVIEKAAGAHIDPQAELLVDTLIQNDAMPLSYFNIPLVLNNRFTGIISITSKNPKAYQEEDMSICIKSSIKLNLQSAASNTSLKLKKAKSSHWLKVLLPAKYFLLWRTAASTWRPSTTRRCGFSS